VDGRSTACRTDGAAPLWRGHPAIGSCRSLTGVTRHDGQGQRGREAAKFAARARMLRVATSPHSWLKRVSCTTSAILPDVNQR